MSGLQVESTTDLLLTLGQLESRKLEVEKGEKREERKVQVGPGGASSSYPEYATSFLAQCYILTGRNLKNVLRTPELFVSRVMAMVHSVLPGI